MKHSHTSWRELNSFMEKLFSFAFNMCVTKGSSAFQLLMISFIFALVIHPSLTCCHSLWMYFASLANIVAIYIYFSVFFLLNLECGRKSGWNLYLVNFRFNFVFVEIFLTWCHAWNFYVYPFQDYHRSISLLKRLK